MIMGEEKSKQEVFDILSHGFEILSNNNLNAFYLTYKMAVTLGVNTFAVQPDKFIIKGKEADWKDYVLILDGKGYKSKFKSEKEWFNHYNK